MKNCTHRILAVLLALCLSGCSFPGRRETETEEIGGAPVTVTSRNGWCLLEGFAMDTLIRLEYRGKDADAAARDAFLAVTDMEKLWSVTDPESEVSRLNEAGEAELSADTAAVLEKALEACRETDGAFDPVLFRLKEVWGWLDDPHVPDPQSLGKALAASGSGKLSLSGSSARLTDGAGIDLGGIAKGRAAEVLASRAGAYEVDSALLNLGGNIRTLGRKPDGSDWKIGIRDPEDGSSLLGVLTLAGSGCVVTSGAYERSFTEDGVTYGHILNGTTGYPAEGDLVSVSVTGTDAARADALSTALFVMGREKAAAFWAERRDFDMVLLDRDGTVWISAGIESSFSTDRPVQTIQP